MRLRNTDIDDAAAALASIGWTLGRGECDLAAKVTRYQVTDQGGRVVVMTAAEIVAMINATN